MKILKFGGTSVGSPENIKKTIAIIKNAQKTDKIAVAVSAFGGLTDKIIESAQTAANGNKDYLKELQVIKKRHFDAVKELTNNKALKNTQAMLQEFEDVLQGIFLIREVSPRTMDLIMSFGERLSAYIISQSIPNAEFLDARTLVKTDENFNNAKVNFNKTNKNIQDHFKNHKKLQIITGFIGSTDNNETTTLGRGGSDYTASIFGAALNAKEIQIWTDVDGIMTADPRKVKKAFSLPNISYEEAMEMSHFGAKVIHPPTMIPAMHKGIPISIRNTMNPGFPGSIISGKQSQSKFPIKGISSINDITLIRLQGSGMVGIPGISQRLFGALAREKINIILITQASSEHSICFAIDPKSKENARKTIEDEFKLEIKDQQIDKAVIEDDLAIIAIVGENMRKSKGVAGKLFQALGKNGINISAIAQGSSELNISVVIPKEDVSKTISVVHDSFFLSGTKSLNVFLIGTGLIGGTLLEQIDKQTQVLQKNQGLQINIAGISNSKKMLFNSDGINIKNWEKELNESKEKADLEKFIQKTITMNLANSVFVDCTANEAVATFYNKIIKESISIVTPNKKAASGTYKCYQEMIQSAKKFNVKYLYETNVGAGLPVINTLNDLLNSGDKIEKIEAVLSGTLSYIFNNFTRKKSFSEVVKEARAKGYTEPDPRDDLNGMDVGRKILILARESGLAMEMKDVQIENLVPEDLQQIGPIDEFLKKLTEHDKDFTTKRDKAEKEGKKLRYIAGLENNKATVSLQAVDENHPFYSLSGSDNIISFTTDRYNSRPLVIKGPGAGAEVTAAGVFADIIRIANYLS